VNQLDPLESSLAKRSGAAAEVFGAPTVFDARRIIPASPVELDAWRLDTRGVAHDINNLLTAIVGSAELAACSMSPGSPGHAHLANIGKAARMASELCNQLLGGVQKQPVRSKALTSAPMSWP